MYRRSSLSLRAGLVGLGVCAMLAGGCSGSSGAASQSSSATPGSTTPPASSGGSTGAYTPAAGTDTSGAIFQRYTNRAAHYHLLYPGGWHVSDHAGIVRIAKLGNAIVIATRTAKSAPKLKPVRAAVAKQETDKAILSVESRPQAVRMHGAPAIRMVFTKQRPATGTAPEATLRVYRYLLFHSGRIVILSLQSPDNVDNQMAYAFVANSFGWDK